MTAAVPSRVLHVPRALLDALFAHALADQPVECCGILIGAAVPDGCEVHEVHPVRNVWDGPKGDRYELEPRALLRLQRESRERGLEIIGYYHGHVDAPSVPSAFDAERAWPGYSYLIVSVHAGRPGEVRSWRFDTAGGQFTEETIEMS